MRDMTYKNFKSLLGKKKAIRRYIKFQLDYPVWVVKRRWLGIPAKGLN